MSIALQGIALRGAIVTSNSGYCLISNLVGGESRPVIDWSRYRHLGYRKYVHDGLVTEAWVVQNVNQPHLSAERSGEVLDQLWDSMQGWRV